MTDSLKSTAGPWESTQPAMGFAEIRANGKLVFAVSNPMRLYGDPDMSSEEKDANLALATSAPDLLAVCDEAADHLYTKQDMDRIREMAKAARAKARGAE